ncbi:MAG: GAF domain-containing protein, partial [Rhodocyclaceae bacterium]
MSNTLDPLTLNPRSETLNPRELGKRLAFFKNLQAVTNKIHATLNIEEIMLELSQDICALFDADRLTIYAVSDDRTAIVSKVKTGLNSFRDLRLPITEQSIAGYVALHRRVVNIHDVYDEEELKALHPNLRFLKEVDRRTGYRTRQMLVGPIIDAHTDELLGVVQIINHKDGTPFSGHQVEGIKGLCETLAIAFSQRRRPEHVVRTKYDHLVLDAVITADELEIAGQTAREKNIDLEEVLLTEFRVQPAAIGSALAKFFGVPYEPFRPERIKPAELMKKLRREYVEQNQWLPIEDGKEGIVVLTLDPEQLRSSRVVNNIFPRNKIAYRVTTIREFRQTVEQFFGAGGSG